MVYIDFITNFIFGSELKTKDEPRYEKRVSTLVFFLRRNGNRYKKMFQIFSKHDTITEVVNSI